MFAVVKFPFKPILLSACVAALAACGGGGGGGGSASGNQASGNDSLSSNASNLDRYDGVKTAPVITEQIAPAIAVTPITVLDFVTIASLFVSEVPHFNMNTGSETIDGEDGGRVKVTVKKESGNIKITLAYNGYSSGGLTVNGIVEQISYAPSASSHSSEFFSLDGVVNFQGLELTTAGSSTLINGTISANQGATTNLVVDAISESLSDGSEFLVDGVFVDVESVQTGEFSSERSLAISVAGTVYDSNYGKLELTTNAPIWNYGYEEYDDNTAGGGISDLVVTGAENHVSFAGLNRKFGSVVFIPSDQTLKPKFKRFLWSELHDNSAMTVQGNISTPVANLGEPLVSNVGQTTRLHGLFSHDSDGDFLEYEWMHIYSPPTSSVLDALNFDEPILEFTPDVAGDYVFQFVVSDGVNQSRVSTKIVVDEYPLSSIYTIQANIGALEITPLASDVRGFVASADSSLPYVSSILDSSIEWAAESWYWLTDVVMGSINPFPVEIEEDVDLFGRYDVYFSAGTSEYYSTSISFVPDNRVPDLYANVYLDDPLHSGWQSSGVVDSDVDSDGDDDLVVQFGVELNVYLKGEDTYSFHQTIVPAELENDLYHEGRFALGDVNKDSRLDVVFNTDLGYYLAIQNASGIFGDPKKISLESMSCESGTIYPESAPQFGDYNADGNVDLFLNQDCYLDAGMIVVLGEGNGEFSDEFTIGLTNGVVGEFTSDNRSDIVVAQEVDGGDILSAVVVYENTPTGYEALYSFENAGFVSSTHLKIADVNGNGRQDILHLEGSSIHLREQTGPGVFTSRTLTSNSDGSFSRLHTAVTVGDFDANGEMDIAVADTYDLFLQMQQDGIFTPVSLGSHSVSWTEDIASTDINGDGYDDLILPNNPLLVYFGGNKTYSVSAE